MIDIRIGVRRALTSQYRRQLHWWECVIMAQRLILAMVFAFWSGLVRVRNQGLTVTANWMLLFCSRGISCGIISVYGACASYGDVLDG